MDKKLIFLLIFAFACTKDKIHPKNERVTISNANPIQFWLTGEESFNQKVECSIYPVCFSQPFSCADTIRTQFTDNDITKEYDLKVLNKSGSTLYTTPFPRTVKYKSLALSSLQFSNYNFQGSLSPWAQRTGGASTEPWAWIINGQIESDGSLHGDNYRDTYRLYQHKPAALYSYPIGSYVINIIGYNSSTGPNANTLFCTLSGSNNDGSTITALSNHTNIATGAFNFNFSFTTTSDWQDLVFTFSIGAPTNVAIVDVNSISIISFPSTGLTYDYSLFDLNFALSSISPSACNQEIQFQIIDHISGSVVAYSDSIFISDYDTDCTVLIEYSNSTNFAGLDFVDESPSPDRFTLRIPAVFFDENFPQEQEDLELSDDTIITLWSKIEGKKLLDIGFMPFYMHKKLQMVLMMDSVSIDGVEYRMRDPYQITPPASKRSALRKASVLLSEKDFINRNLL